MELRKLRYFVAVAESGSISRASSRLGIAQPTLTRQIQALEEDLKCLLFYRHGRGIALTKAGERLYSTLDPMLIEFDQVRQEILEESSVPSGTVRFGIPPSIGSTIVAPLAIRFRESCPDVHLHVVEAFSGTLLEWIEQGTIDLGILYDARRSRSMHVQTVLDENLYLIDRPGNAAGNQTAGIEDIRFDSLVLPGTGHGLRRVIDAMFQQTGTKTQPKLEIDSVPALKQMVELSGAQTILPFGGVYREVQEGRLVARRLDIEGVSAKLVLATALHRPVTKATRMLIEIVQVEIARCVENGILRGRAGNVLGA